MPSRPLSAPMEAARLAAERELRRWTGIVSQRDLQYSAHEMSIRIAKHTVAAYKKAKSK